MAKHTLSWGESRLGHNALAVVVLAILCITGCHRDLGLHPPPNGEVIPLTIQIADDLTPEDVQVIYRSVICKRTGYSASGIKYERDGYQNLQLRPIQTKKTGLFEVLLPVDGGGDCKWKISNVTFGVKYNDPSRFGEQVVYAGGGGVIVIFDNNNSPRGPANLKVDGDLHAKIDYYPWIHETYLGEYKERLLLKTRERDVYLMYHARQAKKIHFEAVVHNDFLVRSKGPKVKAPSNYTPTIYPDGSIDEDGLHGPDFEKLQAIRQAAERPR